jgi:hypothetical protein
MTFRISQKAVNLLSFSRSICCMESANVGMLNYLKPAESVKTFLSLYVTEGTIIF